MTHTPDLIIAFDGLEREVVERTLAGIKEGAPEVISRVVFKVNDLLLEIGLDGVKEMVDSSGMRVMLDPKTDDIPATIKNAMRKLKKSGLGELASYYTIKASAGYKGMRAAVEEKEKLGLKTKLLAISVLTSMDEKDCQETFNAGVQDQVKNFVRMAVNAGMDGFVCSPLEVQLIKETIRDEYPGLDPNVFEYVTPGMRFDNSDSNDQARIGTPESAVENKAHAVMGRPILGDVEKGKPYTIAETIEAIRRFIQITKDKAKAMHNQE